MAFLTLHPLARLRLPRGLAKNYTLHLVPAWGRPMTTLKKRASSVIIACPHNH